MTFTITTKYMPATNTSGSRIKATISYGKSASISYPYELSGRECHDAAVRECLKRNHLDHLPHRFAIGDNPNGQGYIYLAMKPTTDTVTFAAPV